MEVPDELTAQKQMISKALEQCDDLDMLVLVYKLLVTTA